MNQLSLQRSYLDNATFGKVFYQGQFILYTLERPWESNKSNISCVPPGLYSLGSHTKDRLYIENKDLGVTLYGPSTRTAILIHIANYVHQLKGCIAPGMSLHPTTWGIANSTDAMIKLLNLVETEKITHLDITI